MVDLSPAGSPSSSPAPLRSVHTDNLPALLGELGVSLLVTTYQAGKLVIVRPDGEHINTHFRDFQAPMGLALTGDRLALGTTWQICEFHNVPAVAAKLPPPGRHDACFLPRLCSLDRERSGTRDGLGRRHALVRQHPLLLPVHAGLNSQLRPPLAPPVRLCAGAGGPLSLERASFDRRPAAAGHGPGRLRRPRRLRAGQGARRRADRRRRRRLDRARTLDAALAPLARRPDLAARVGHRDPGRGRPG